jgi:uncharacterized protein
MRILIDILHPAHVHFFANFYQEMSNKGHELYLTGRVKDCAIELLEHYQIPYKCLSVQSGGTLSLGLELVQRSWRLKKHVKAFKPDVLTGIMGPSIALVGKALGIPAVVFYDTEFAKQTNWFVYPLAHSVCTPDCYQGKVRGRHVPYPGYHELAYLHPSRFQADPEVLKKFGLQEGENFSMMRFVSWRAIHDIRERGLKLTEKQKLLSVLEAHGRVLISSEGDLPPELESRRINGPVGDIHHLLAHAQIIVGESATMSSEAAVLGVPAVFIAKTGRGYTDDQEERYGLCRYFTEERLDEAIAVIEERFQNRDLERWNKARQQLLADKIDVTDWMVQYFEKEFSKKN